VRSKTLGLDFVIPPEGDRLILVDVATGEPLLGLRESESAREAEREAREAAERRERREAQARRAAESRAEAAEAENQKLAREIERLRAELREG
jgi:predicted RNase H-like nuclease (RuvC/YqgF family)